MSWFLKILLNQAITMLEGTVMAYVKKTPDTWDDEVATLVFDFLKRFVNGTVAQQKAAFESLREARSELPAVKPAAVNADMVKASKIK